MNEEQQELKSCPFCGWENPVWHVERYAYDWGECAVHCANCGAEGATTDSRESAAIAWNKRAPDNAELAAEVARLKAEAAVPVEVREAIESLRALVVAYVAMQMGNPTSANEKYMREARIVRVWLDKAKAQGHRQNSSKTRR